VLKQQVKGASLELPPSGGDQWTVRRKGREVARFTVRANAILGSVGIRKLPDPAAGMKAPGEGAVYLKIDGNRLADLLRRDRGSFSRDDVRTVSTLGSVTLQLRAEAGALTAVSTIGLGP
jgi:hypothetical protein